MKIGIRIMDNYKLYFCIKAFAKWFESIYEFIKIFPYFLISIEGHLEYLQDLTECILIVEISHPQFSYKWSELKTKYADTSVFRHSDEIILLAQLPAAWSSLARCCSAAPHTWPGQWSSSSAWRLRISPYLNPS